MLTYNRFICFVNRRVKTLFNARLRRDVDPETEAKLVLYLTNYCNDQCFSCSTLCDKPRSNYFNKNPYDMSYNELNTLLTNLGEYGRDLPVRFAGGEPTLNPNIDKLAKLVRHHDRHVDIITNGIGFYNESLDPYLFDWIYLDKHLENKLRIEKVEQYFNSLGFENYTKILTHYHWDIEEMRENNISFGIRCPLFMKGVTVYNKLVYPCCVFPPLTGWDNDGEIIDRDLYNAGYVYDNPNLPELLTNWRKYLPSLIYKKCGLSCWRGASRDQVKLYPTNYRTQRTPESMILSSLQQVEVKTQM